MVDDANPGAEIPLARRVILPYQQPLAGAAVTVAKFNDLVEAQLYANELAGHGIEYYLANQNTRSALALYGGFSQVELQVRHDDAQLATELLASLNVDPAEVEPADDMDPMAPIEDPSGQGMLVAAAAYESPQQLYDAAAALGAARIECFLPVLLARGQCPAGVGRRFVVRVRQADLERASVVLEQEQADSDDEPRCPRCGSWRVHQLPPPWPGLLNLLLGRTSHLQQQMECLRCHHTWAASRGK